MCLIFYMYKAIFIGHTTVQASKPSTVSNEWTGEGRHMTSMQQSYVASNQRELLVISITCCQVSWGDSFQAQPTNIYHFQGQEFLDIEVT